MKKVFISQLMKGKTDEEIKKERQELTEEAKKLFGIDCEIIDSFFEGAPAHKKPLWFLGKSIEKLADAEVVIMGKGWEKGRGCVIENECAKFYGIDIVYGGNSDAC